MLESVPLIQLASAALSPLFPRELSPALKVDAFALAQQVREGIRVLETIHDPASAWAARENLRANHRQLKALLARLPACRTLDPMPEIDTFARLSRRALAIPQVAPALSRDLNPILQTLSELRQLSRPAAA